ncbi:MAG: TetR/AcrR family transcriptional regulator [Clostridiales bacterium]|nr:TetR/AcrR family transcriptional regulator [Clostridiales bacterium]
MLKKLTEDQQALIIEKATCEFAEKGYKGAGLSAIAKSAGVSVGVIYKYYADKEELFQACVRRSIDYLDEALVHAGGEGKTLPEMIRDLVHQTQTACRERPEYFRMYHQITASDDALQVKQLAEIIERPSAKAYRDTIRKAQKEGLIDGQLDSGAGAFFFDNLMMMLHYAYSCVYYKERMNIYCGKKLSVSEKKLGEQMVRFILNGLGYKGEY